MEITEPKLQFKESANKETSSGILARLREYHRSPLFIVPMFAITHLIGFVGLILIFQGSVQWTTLLFAQVLTDLCILRVTMGAHRLWAHRSYKAKTPLKIILATCFAFTGQQSLWLWTAWHRVHHKFTDTDADPHNSARGFFYSHIGWLLTYDHKSFVKHIDKIDMTDLEREPIIMFHERYYPLIHHTCVYVIPTLIPWLIFGETFVNSFCVAACLIYIYCSHRTYIVNSWAHAWGYKPYDSSIRPVENKFISFLTFGEGWHNYHHVFPWDYKTAELGFYRWNISTAVIDFFGWIGWAYDLKSVPEDIVMRRVKRTGNHELLQHGPWGWGDADIPKENILATETEFPGKSS